MKHLVIIFSLLFSALLFSADNIVSPKTQADQYLVDANSRTWMLYTVYTTDGNNNVIPLATATNQSTANASLASIDAKFSILNAKDFSTSAKQDTGNSSLSSIDGKFTTLNSTDFSTSAKQDTGNTSLSSIDGKFTTLNGKDFATSVKQDAGNTSLSSIDSKASTTNSTLSTISGKIANNGNGDIKVNFSNLYRNVSGNATTVVKSGAGVLHMFCINNNQAGGTFTVYDNTSASGTVMFTFTGGTFGGGVLSPYQTSGPICLGPFGAEFSTGLTIVSAGSTSNNFTAVYR